eukprot:CAMPEP_0170551172 /NCGR_PEP_ID=MMETSP0211-20121228/9200_1 /TAXON_ID=311385 /ORGANISM="Pseudokeronopsis sp., Strain OXSARD2" /LENGTH=38 /DNA_ID= /DNA_START= /DNA_END= /DNA_ORIENTATION=
MRNLYYATFDAAVDEEFDKMENNSTEYGQDSFFKELAI